MKKGKRPLALVVAVSLLAGLAPMSSTSYAEETEATLNETLLLEDDFSSNEWNTTVASPIGWWRYDSGANYVGALDDENGTAPLGNQNSNRNLYESSDNDGKLTDVHIKSKVCVTGDVTTNTSAMYHMLIARGTAEGKDGIVFGFKTDNNANKSSLIVALYEQNSTFTSTYVETAAIYPTEDAYELELYVIGESLVIAKCNSETIFAGNVSDTISGSGYCGIIDRLASSDSSATTYGGENGYQKGGYFDDFSISTITLDSFNVNGSVVADKTGNGKADISIMSGDVKVTDMEDVNVTVSEITAPTLRYIDLREESAITLHGLCMEANSPTFARMDLDVAEEIAGSTEFSKTSVYTHARESAGGRMRFSTDSSVIAIKAEFPSYISDYATEMGAGKTGFDVYVDTEAGSTYYGTISPTDAQLPTENKTWSYEGQIEFDTQETRNITIYFPITNEVSEVSVGVEENATVASNAITYDDAKPIVFYGSSITQGGVATKPGLTYVNTVGRMLGRDYIDLGVWGSAKGETEFANYIAGLDMSMFVFDYDHNAPNAQHLADTHYAFYEIVRAVHSDIPIIFITRPNEYGDWEKHKEVIQGNHTKAVAAGDTNVYFIDGQTFFAGQTDCLADGVHPTDKGHSLMAASIGPVLADILGETLPVQVTDAGTGASNLTSSLNEGKYLVTLKDELPVTTKTAKVEKVFVVSDLSKAVTSMSDTRWTGSTAATPTPKFKVDGSGKATLTPSGSTAAGLSVLNVGENNGSYTNFYTEYTLTVSGLTGTTNEEGKYRSDINNVFSIDSYGSEDTSKSWLATMFYDNRTSQVNGGKEFWARLTDLNGTHKNYSDSTSATDGIEIGTPVKVGMLVYDHTITLFFNDVEAATVTDDNATYTGWFGISQSYATGTAIVENFIYVPLEKEIVDFEMAEIEDVQLYDEITTPSVTPVYNWPNGSGEATTDGVTIEGFDNTRLGEQTVTVKYTENNVTFSKKVMVKVVDDSIKTIISEDFEENGLSNSDEWTTLKNVSLVDDGKLVMNSEATAQMSSGVNAGCLETTLTISDTTLTSLGKAVDFKYQVDNRNYIILRLTVAKDAEGIEKSELQVYAYIDNKLSSSAPYTINHFALNTQYKVCFKVIGNYVEVKVNGEVVQKLQRSLGDTNDLITGNGRFGFETTSNATVTMDDLSVVKYTPYTIKKDETITLQNCTYTDISDSSKSWPRSAFYSGEQVVLAVSEEQQLAVGGLTYTLDGVADSATYSVFERLYDKDTKPEVCNQFKFKMPSCNITLNAKYYDKTSEKANIGARDTGIREKDGTYKYGLRFSSRAYTTYTSGEVIYTLKEVGTLLFNGDVTITNDILSDCYQTKNNGKKLYNENDVLIGKCIPATKAQNICDDFWDWGVILTYQDSYEGTNLYEKEYKAYAYAVYVDSNGNEVVHFASDAKSATHSYNAVAEAIGWSTH